MQHTKNLLTVLILLLSGSVTLAQVTGLSDWDIYLDPGHSQKENMGIFGYSEAEKVLRVGLQLRDLLLAKTDIDTVYNSRFTDRDFVGLSQRTDEANTLGAAWFHSIHSDAGPPRLNSTLLLWGQLQNGQEKTPRGGRAMSDIMVGILTRAMRTNTRGSVGDCSFFNCNFQGPYLSVNRRSIMPSELSEAGFHTSPVQNVRNMNAQWPRLEAFALFWSILRFHDIAAPPVGIVTGFVFDVEKERPLNGARIRIAGQEYITDTFESLFNRFHNDPEKLQNGFYFLEDLPNETLEMIVDADGFYPDTLQVSIIDTFFTFVDVDLISSVSPMVTSTDPEPDEARVPILQDIVVNFSRRMNSASVAAAIRIKPEVSFTTFWQNEFRTLVIQTDTLMNDTEYTVTILGDAVDLFDHLFDGNSDGVGGDDFFLIFTTEPVDVIAPTILSQYPLPGAIGVENPPIINFEFDERLKVDTIAETSIILERKVDGTPVSGTIRHYVVNNRSLLSFFPGALLDIGAEYVAKVQPGLEDQFGNATQNEQVLVFTTQEFTSSIRIIDNFETGITSNWWVPQQSGTTRGIISDRTSRAANGDFKNLLSNSQRSMQINYGWDTQAGSWLIREFLSGGPPRSVLFNTADILQMYIFGDGSGNQIRFAVDDRVPVAAVGNHEVSVWFTIDWVGWRLISWDLANDPTGTWLGDGTPDGSLRIDSIQLTHVPGAADSGVLYFDDLRLVRTNPTSVSEQRDRNLPRRFALFQNYPNPFNPETSIGYAVANKPHHVKLIIYDILGRQVRVLVNQVKKAGEHTVRWDGKDRLGSPVASGTYLYKIAIDDFVETRKMTLIR